MEDFLKPQEGKRGVNKVFLGGIIVGVVLLGAAIFALSMRPSVEEQTAQILASAFREGSPEYAAHNRDIIISTDDNTVESPMGLGTISMFIQGKIRNRGTKTFRVLEVSVSVVTQTNDVLRERKILVVPKQKAALGPGEIIPITLTMDGFDKDDDRANIRWKVTALRVE